MTMKSYALWTAVVTPMTDTGAVDFESLTKVCKQQTEAKNGLLILGSTGEALNLSLTTRKKIIEHVLSLAPTFTPLNIFLRLFTVSGLITA